MSATNELTGSRPEILRMSELNDNSELQKYSSAVLYVLSAVDPPEEYVGAIAESFLQAIKSSSVSRPVHHEDLQSHQTAVMAYSFEGASHTDRILLSQPHEHTWGGHVKDHGCSSRLPGG